MKISTFFPHLLTNHTSMYLKRNNSQSLFEKELDEYFCDIQISFSQYCNYFYNRCIIGLQVCMARSNAPHCIGTYCIFHVVYTHLVDNLTVKVKMIFIY